MKFETLLAREPRGGLWLKTSGAGRARRVCTVSEACRRLSRTRRQVYRYIAEKTLEPCGKLLGEWLLDLDSVTRLAQSPSAAQPLPARLQAFFPEYDVARLNAGRDRVTVLSRLLESGSRGDVRWLLKRYRLEDIRRFLREDGARLLSPRSLRLWSLYFRVRPRPLPDSRRRANPWLEYRYPLLKPVSRWKGLAVASIEDISAMKVSAIVGRGSRKDFIDLYWISRKAGLETILRWAERKFSGHADFILQAARALVFFEDAEKEPLPRLLKQLSWGEVRACFEKEVPACVRRVLGA